MGNGDAFADSGRAKALPLKQGLEDLALGQPGDGCRALGNFLKRLFLAVGFQRRNDGIRCEKVVNDHDEPVWCNSRAERFRPDRVAARKSLNPFRGSRQGGRRVYPPNVAVATAVYDVHPAIASVSENQHRRAGEIEFRDRIAHTQIMQGAGGFSDDGRM